MRRLPRHPFILSCLLAAGCARSQFDLATQREGYTITSTEKEVEMGRKIARRVEQELPPVADEALQERVRSIGQRLAAVCDRKELVYSFTVVQDQEVNAFSLPGGYVFLNEELIKKTANDDELAAVIAHEVAHVAARHAIKRYEGGLGMQLVTLATLISRQGEAAKGLSVAAQAAQLAYARHDELEADRLGVKYMKAAGFNPEGMLTFLEKLHAIDQSKPHYLPKGIVRPQYAMTHPYAPERIRTIKEALFGVADYIDYLNTAPQ